MPTFAGSCSAEGCLAWDTRWKALILHNEFSAGCHIEHPLWGVGGTRGRVSDYVKRFCNLFMAYFFSTWINFLYNGWMHYGASVKTGLSIASHLWQLPEGEVGLWILVGEVHNWTLCGSRSKIPPTMLSFIYDWMIGPEMSDGMVPKSDEHFTYPSGKIF